MYYLWRYLVFLNLVAKTSLELFFKCFVFNLKRCFHSLTSIGHIFSCQTFRENSLKTAGSEATKFLVYTGKFLNKTECFEYFLLNSAQKVGMRGF